MVKKPDVARGRIDKEFYFEVENDMNELGVSKWQLSYDRHCEKHYQTHINLAPYTRPSRPYTGGSTTSPSSAVVVASFKPSGRSWGAVPTAAMVPAPMEAALAKPARVAMSRKERKRFAAKQHAAHVGTLADEIVRDGIASSDDDEADFVADPAIAYPMARLPFDVVRDVLLPFLDIRSVVCCLVASRGMMFLLQEDSLWRNIFNANDLHRVDPKVWKRIRDRSHTWRKKTEMVIGITDSKKSRTEHEALLVKAKECRRLQSSEESAAIRSALTARTRYWADVEEAFYVHPSTGRVHPGHMRPSFQYTVLCEKWVSVGYYSYPKKYLATKSKPDYCCYMEYRRKSEALQKQYECPHNRVAYRTGVNWLMCLDCGLYCQATSRPAKNVFIV